MKLPNVQNIEKAKAKRIKLEEIPKYAQENQCKYNYVLHYFDILYYLAM